MRRTRRNNKSTNGKLWLFIIGGILAISLLPYLLLGIAIYFYIDWQDKKLYEHNGDWKEFYEIELKPKFKYLILLPILYLLYLINPDKGKSVYSQLDSEDSTQIVEEKNRELNKRMLDSSYEYVNLAGLEFANKKYKKALKYLEVADSFYICNPNASLLKGRTLMNLKRYKESISVLEGIIGRSSELNDDIYLNIGICYLKMGNRPKAVFNLYEAVKLDNTEAEEIYDKVNPKLKKVIGYYTKCCDGSSSSATGRGACSHHGGVCNWNAPIYSEERKYELE